MRDDGPGLFSVLSEEQCRIGPDWAPVGDGTPQNRLRVVFEESLCAIAQVELEVAEDGFVTVGDIRSIATPDRAACGPHWSPEGDEIAFGGSQEGSDGIFVVDTAGGQVMRLLDTDEDNPVFRLAWHPDGSAIAFAEDSMSSGQIANALRILHRSSGDVTTVVDFGVFRNIGAIDWSPDGQLLAFTAREGGWGTEAVYTLQLSQNDQGNFVAESTAVQQIDGGHPSFGPDGDRLVIPGPDTGELRILDLNSGAVTELGRARGVTRLAPLGGGSRRRP